MQEEIKTAQDGFTKSVVRLRSQSASNTIYIPYLAMSADADALRAMKNLP